MTPTPTTSRDTLRRALDQAGISQAELARRSRVREATISEYLRAIRDIRTETLDRLMVVLAVAQRRHNR